MTDPINPPEDLDLDPTKIRGHERKLTQAEIDTINDIKHRAERLLQAVEAVEGRWAAIAKTQIQLGTMAAVRAVAAPHSLV